MIQLDGWWCPKCRCWNGLEKNRRTCRSCDAPRTAPEGLSREDLFRLVNALLVENVAMLDNVTAMQEKLGRYIECAQAAKAVADDEEYPDRSVAIPLLKEVVRRLEDDPMTAAAMLRPYEPPTTAEAEWADTPLLEDDSIKAAHPTRTGRHKLYAEAQRLVSARHSKVGLIELVNWLLFRCVSVLDSHTRLQAALVRIRDASPSELECDAAAWVTEALAGQDLHLTSAEMRARER
jgi:hypothetical protein